MVFQRNYMLADLILRADFSSYDFELCCQMGFPAIEWGG
jgi:hypothetical protein